MPVGNAREGHSVSPCLELSCSSYNAIWATRRHPLVWSAHGNSRCQRPCAKHFTLLPHHEVNEQRNETKRNSPFTRSKEIGITLLTNSYMCWIDWSSLSTLQLTRTPWYLSQWQLFLAIVHQLSSQLCFSREKKTSKQWASKLVRTIGFHEAHSSPFCWLWSYAKTRVWCM